MATFYDNLRASRTRANTLSGALPTRGDMQKERAAANPPQVSFIDVLRNVFFPSFIRQKEPAEAIDSFIDKGNPEDLEDFQNKSDELDYYARKGTMFAEDNVDRQNAAKRGTSYIDRGMDRYLTKDFLDNYDLLNKALDDYDKAPTWAEKHNVVENTAKKFDELPDAINVWLNELDYQTRMGRAYGDTNPKDISEYMRRLNRTVKKLMTPKAY